MKEGLAVCLWSPMSSAGRSRRCRSSWQIKRINKYPRLLHRSGALRPPRSGAVYHPRHAGVKSTLTIWPLLTFSRSWTYLVCTGAVYLWNADYVPGPECSRGSSGQPHPQVKLSLLCVIDHIQPEHECAHVCDVHVAACWVLCSLCVAVPHWDIFTSSSCHLFSLCSLISFDIHKWII